MLTPCKKLHRGAKNLVNKSSNKIATFFTKLYKRFFCFPIKIRVHNEMSENVRPVDNFLLGGNDQVIEEENVTQFAFLGDTLDDQPVLHQISLIVSLPASTTNDTRLFIHTQNRTQMSATLGA